MKKHFTVIPHNRLKISRLFSMRFFLCKICYKTIPLSPKGETIRRFGKLNILAEQLFSKCGFNAEIEAILDVLNHG